MNSGPIEKLDRLKFAIAAMVRIAGEPGSYQYEQAKWMARGIEAEIDAAIAQLKQEGVK